MHVLPNLGTAGGPSVVAQNHPPATMRACSAAGTKMVGRTTRLGSAQYPWKLPPQATKEMRQRKLPCHAERAIGSGSSGKVIGLRVHTQCISHRTEASVEVTNNLPGNLVSVQCWWHDERQGEPRDWAMPNTLGSPRLMQHKSMYPLCPAARRRRRGRWPSPGAMSAGSAAFPHFPRQGHPNSACGGQVLKRTSPHG